MPRSGTFEHLTEFPEGLPAGAGLEYKRDDGTLERKPPLM